MNDSLLINGLDRVYCGLLRLYPVRFRTGFAAEMSAVFIQRLQVARRDGRIAIVKEASCEFFDLTWGIFQQHRYERGIKQIMTQQEESTVNSTLSWRTRSWHLLRETGSMLLLAGALVLVMNLFIPRYIVEGASMQPTFTNGDFLLTSPLPYLVDEPQRGDVIVLHPSSQADQPPLLKRIIGLPGETVQIAGGAVTVDGLRLDEPYINAPPSYSNTWHLGTDEYFVLGDNRNRSNDSADFGPIQRTSIVGRVLLTYWPPADWSSFPRPDYGPGVLGE